MVPYESIDRLLLVEARPQNLVQDVIPKLYWKVRTGGPLTIEIARVINGLQPGRVAIVTGIAFPPHLPHGEVDGLIGSAVLGRLLQRLGHTVDVLVETEVMPPMRAVAESTDLQPGWRDTSHRDVMEMRAWATEYDLAIAIEKLGRNRKGFRHTIVGTQLHQGDSVIDDLFLEMGKLGKPTIGIGDGGNEIGFGAIFETARMLVPKGRECGCPCGDGIVTSTPCSYLLPVSVSNYGAYGIAAALAVMRGDTSFAPSPEQIRHLIEICIANGAIDGGTGDPSFLGDDGIPIDGVAAFVGYLKTIVGQWLKVFTRHF